MSITDTAPRVFTSQVNTYCDGTRVLALCLACVRLQPAVLWSHAGSPAERPGCGCDRCGAAQAELPGVPAGGMDAYWRRAQGQGGWERAMAEAYTRMDPRWPGAWRGLFADLSTLLANGWDYTD